MAGELTIRPYRASDAERVWTIHRLALEASPLEFDETAPDEDLETISTEYLDSGGEFLVGCVNDEIVAIGGIQPRDDDVAEIRRMRVHPEYQRNGYAERILAALEHHARERGFARLVLYTSDELSSAKCLYEKHGYRVVGRETHGQTGDEFVHYEKYL